MCVFSQTYEPVKMLKTHIACFAISHPYTFIFLVKGKIITFMWDLSQNSWQKALLNPPYMYKYMLVSLFDKKCCVINSRIHFIPLYPCPSSQLYIMYFVKLSNFITRIAEGVIMICWHDTFAVFLNKNTHTHMGDVTVVLLNVSNRRPFGYTIVSVVPNNDILLDVNKKTHNRNSFVLVQRTNALDSSFLYFC